MIFLYVLLLIAGTLLPALIWLCFFLKEDVHPEPKRVIIRTFLFGAIASAPVFFLQFLLQEFTGEIGEGGGVLAFAGLALTEEIFKFLAVYLSVRKDPAFDEPIDSMIYMIVGALGFTTIENFFIMASTLNTSAGLNIAGSLGTITFRFIGATLLHILASGLVGYYWARSWKTVHKTHLFVRGFIYATALHSLFNYLILKFQNINLLIPSFFLIFVMFFLLYDFEKIKVEEH